MNFSQISEYVDSKLETMELDQRVLLFKEVLDCPIDVTFKKYHYLNQEWDELRMKDFMSITQHWLSVKQYDMLYKHFKSLTNLS
jgi:hypothetical protein